MAYFVLYVLRPLDLVPSLTFTYKYHPGPQNAQNIEHNNSSLMQHEQCSKVTSQWRHASTCSRAVSEVTEPDVSVTFEMEHAAAAIASHDRLVAVSYCPRVADGWQVRTADRCPIHNISSAAECDMAISVSWNVHKMRGNVSTANIPTHRQQCAVHVIATDRQLLAMCISVALLCHPRSLTRARQNELAPDALLLITH